MLILVKNFQFREKFSRPYFPFDTIISTFFLFVGDDSTTVLACEMFTSGFYSLKTSRA